jgi:hypothetical protein
VLFSFRHHLFCEFVIKPTTAALEGVRRIKRVMGFNGGGSPPTGKINGRDLIEQTREVVEGIEVGVDVRTTSTDFPE